MKPDLKKFFRACNPSKTLNMANAEDRKYYIDFSSVRGAEIIEELGQTITSMSPEPTCQLFTGHIGCGKSTELLRLKAELEKDGFHVVYFESTEVLDMGDVDISDILLAIALRVSESLEGIQIQLQSKNFTNLLQESVKLLKTPIELKAEAKLSVFIGKIMAKAKDNPQVRSLLREYLEPQTALLLKAINEELLGQAESELQKRNKKGLVVIIDNLDRLDNRTIASGQTLPEYLFMYRGDQLGRLNCHLVYTIPLTLIFSHERETLKQRLGGGISPMVLPMVPVKLPDDSDYLEGLRLLQQMVLARAFPDLSPEERLDLITEVFDSPETLDRLCQVSGGHVRNLLGLLLTCLRKGKRLPITRDSLEIAIRQSYNDLRFAIKEDEWKLLNQVAQSKKVTGEQKYQMLLRGMFVFEYRNDQGEVWFDINPILAEAKQFKRSDKPVILYPEYPELSQKHVDLLIALNKAGAATAIELEINTSRIGQDLRSELDLLKQYGLAVSKPSQADIESEIYQVSFKGRKFIRRLRLAS
ncbi:MAG: P-loop NTPase fold protein [Xenococcaceae cyanobacterium]